MIQGDSVRLCLIVKTAIAAGFLSASLCGVGDALTRLQTIQAGSLKLGTGFLPRVLSR